MDFLVGPEPTAEFPPISRVSNVLFGRPGHRRGRSDPSSMRHIFFVNFIFGVLLANIVAGQSDVTNSTRSAAHVDGGAISAIVLLGGFFLVALALAIRRERKNQEKFREMMADLCDRPLKACPEDLSPESGTWSGLSEDQEFCARICPISQRVYRWTVTFHPDGTLTGTGSDNDSSFSISGKFSVDVPFGHNQSFGRNQSFRGTTSFRQTKTDFIWLETDIANGKSLENGLTVQDHADLSRRMQEADTFCARLTCHCCNEMEPLKICKGSLQFENSEVSIVGTYMSSKNANGTFSHRLINRKTTPRAETDPAPNSNDDAETDLSAPAAKNSQAENLNSISSFKRGNSIRGPPKLNERESQFKDSHAASFRKSPQTESVRKDPQLDSVRSSDSRQGKGIMKRTESNPPSLYQSQDSMVSSVHSDWNRSQSMHNSARRPKESHSRSHRRLDRPGSVPVRDMEEVLSRDDANNFFHPDEQVISIKENEELREDDPADFHQMPRSPSDRRPRHNRPPRRATSLRESAVAKESKSPPLSAHDTVSPKISWRDGFDSSKLRDNGSDGTPKVSWRDGFNSGRKDDVDSNTPKVSWRDGFDHAHARQSVPPRQPNSGQSVPPRQPSSGDSIREEMIPLPTDDEGREGFKSNTSSLLGGHNPDPPPRQGSSRGWPGMGGSAKRKEKKEERSPPAILMTEQNQALLISADIVAAPAGNADARDASYKNLTKVTNLDDRGLALTGNRRIRPAHEREGHSELRVGGSRGDDAAREAAREAEREAERERERASERARERAESSARRQGAAPDGGRLREDRRNRDRGGMEEGGRAEGRRSGREREGGGREEGRGAQAARAESGASARGDAGREERERREPQRTGSSRPGAWEAAGGSSRNVAERAGREGGRELGRGGSRRQESEGRADGQATARPRRDQAMLTPRGNHLVT